MLVPHAVECDGIIQAPPMISVTRTIMDRATARCSPTFRRAAISARAVPRRRRRTYEPLVAHLFEGLMSEMGVDQAGKR
jgi:hypothetical protein